MIASRGDQLVDVLVARLQPPEDLSELSQELQDLLVELGAIVVDRYPIRQGDGARVRVYPFEEKVTPMGVKLVRRELLVKFELFRLIPEGVEADQAIDPLYLWCVSRLLSDRDLSGLVDWVEEKSRAWGAREGEQAHAKMLLELTVVYRTLAGHPDRRA